jgi:hypothetical protein
MGKEHGQHSYGGTYVEANHFCIWFLAPLSGICQQQYIGPHPSLPFWRWFQSKSKFNLLSQSLRFVIIFFACQMGSVNILEKSSDPRDLQPPPESMQNILSL